MSRLIDADKLLCELNNKRIKFVPEINDIILNQPTAYDVDKVVEELEDKINMAKKLIVDNVADDLDRIANDTAEDFITAYSEAIEIVKVGGID